ncbi:hypothetical protein FE391_37585 [Nonomuraea sp. KC401]|uniref:hypothetical protein n=1 Tax=unclassified Nonomuraea TaxID=2593643 RepID=UPI0010FD0164|nr:MULTISPECIES: hypothetical protein [unclassified Nonomuraea]NBE98927.1 hypothetical protein [Nonomuraea sp. K271]TLF57644.1 hypothetical protein FE391_37585 [Nonomuraea sp. KC401]
MNKAFTDARARSAAEISAPHIDPLAMAQHMRELRDNLSVRTSRINASINEGVLEVRSEVMISSDVPTLAFADMFDQLICSVGRRRQNIQSSH